MALIIAHPWTASDPIILPVITRPNYNFTDTISITADPAGSYPQDLISGVTVTRTIAGENVDGTSETRNIPLPVITITNGTSHTSGSDIGYETASIGISGKYGDPFLDTFKLVDADKGFHERRGGASDLSARQVYSNQIYEKIKDQKTFQSEAHIVRGFTQLPPASQENLFSLEQDMTSKIVITYTVTISYDKWTATNAISTVPADINETETVIIPHDINNNFGAISIMLRERNALT